MKRAVCLAALVGLPVIAGAQQPARPSASQSDLAQNLLPAIVDGGAYAKEMITTSAERMSEDDYAFRPTAEVRSFGELLAHVADSNYGFCATVKGEEAPVSGIEKTKKGRAEIRQALSDSFAYCDTVFSSLNARNVVDMVQFRGKARPAGVVLTFFNYHSMLHYGNAITYMRLRGKIPPSTEPTPK